MTSTLEPASRAFPFPATMWSRVLRTRESGDTEAVKAALEDLCAAYLRPVTGYLRALGCVNEADDVAQDFFATFLQRDGFQRAEPERGRLRAYLKCAVRHHLYHWRRDRSTLQRGGGMVMVELDDVDAPELAAADDEAALIYDQEWALTVFERALVELRTSYQNRQRLELFERLKPVLLTPQPGQLDVLAGQLGMSRGALAVEQHRARRRFADLLRAQVAETVADPAEVDRELLHLMRVLAQTGTVFA